MFSKGSNLFIAIVILLSCQPESAAQQNRAPQQATPTPSVQAAPSPEPVVPSNPGPSPGPVTPSQPGTALEPVTPPNPGTSSVEGSVTDYVGDHPLGNATIVLTRVGEEHRRYATESNAQGKFAFRNVEPGEWELTVSAPDMVSQTDVVRLEKDKVKIAQVALEDLEAADVLKVASKRKLVHPETTRVETHLDKNFLTQYGNGNNLRKVIETAPGVMTDSFGNIVTRGEHDAVNYEIDGAILPEAAGVLQQGQFASPRSLQSVDVAVGGYEAKDGGGPMGAVVKMRSMPINSKPTLEVGTQLGGPMQGGLNYYASTAVSQNPQSLLHRLRLESSGLIFGTKLGIQPPTRHFRRDGRVDFNILNKVEFQPTDKDKFLLTAAINETFLHIPTSAQSRAAGVKINQHDRQNYIMLSYQHKFQKWLDEANLHIINAFYSQQINSTNVFDPQPVINGDGFIRSASPTASRYDFALSIQGDVSKTVANHHFLAGILSEVRPVRTRFQEWVYNADPRGPLYSSAPYGAMISPFTGTTTGPMFQGNVGRYRGFRYIQSAYIQDKWHGSRGIFKRVVLDAGLRADVYHGVFGNTMGLAQMLATIPGIAPFSMQPFQRQTVTDAQVSGRYGATLQVTQKTVLRGSFSQLFVPPPVDIFVAPFDVTGGTNNGIFPGTPKPLSAETGKLVDVGIEQQMGPRSVLKSTIFYKKIKNFGDSGVIDNTTVYNRLMLSGQEAYGSETRFELKPDRAGYGFNGYVSNTVAVAYLRGTKNDTGGIYVSPDPVYTKFPDHDLRETLQSGLGYRTRSNIWSLATVSAATGYKDDRDPTFFGPHPARTQPYAVWNLNFGWNLPKRYKDTHWLPVSCDVRIQNLTNNTKPINLGSPFQGTRYLLPIRVLAGMNWQV